MKSITLAACTISLLLFSSCRTYEGYGRYDLGYNRDKVIIYGLGTFTATKQGNEIVIDKHTAPRGVYRKTKPWLYVHQVRHSSVDVTFDRGSKELYPVYTGLTAAIRSNVLSLIHI